VLAYYFDYTVGPNSEARAWILCPSGARATGGGGTTETTAVFVDVSYPISAADTPAGQTSVPIGWEVEVSSISAATRAFRAYVVCAAP
jgi:hypothetical protein